MLVKLTSRGGWGEGGVRLRVKTCLNVSQRVVSLSLRHLMRCQFQVEQETEGKENKISRKFSFFNSNINLLWLSVELREVHYSYINTHIHTLSLFYSLLLHYFFSLSFLSFIQDILFYVGL